MSVSSTIVINIIILLLQFLIGLTKFKTFGLILILISCAIFLTTNDDIFYDLAVTQLIVFFVMYVLNRLTSIVLSKRKNKDIDKSKIKDL